MRKLVLLVYFVCVYFSVYTFNPVSFTWGICIKDAKFRILQPHFMQFCLSFLQLHWQFAHQFLIYNERHFFFPPTLEDIVAVRLATYGMTELQYVCAVEITLKICRKWALNTIFSLTCHSQPHPSAWLSLTAGIV